MIIFFACAKDTAKDFLMCVYTQKVAYEASVALKKRGAFVSKMFGTEFRSSPLTLKHRIEKNGRLGVMIITIKQRAMQDCATHADNYGLSEVRSSVRCVKSP